jgi:hypothetical protein
LILFLRSVKHWIIVLSVTVNNQPNNTDKNMTTATAQDWIDTDPNACRADVKRLGLDKAVEYQLSLIIDRAAAGGDNRWDDAEENMPNQSRMDAEDVARQIKSRCAYSVRTRIVEE